MAAHRALHLQVPKHCTSNCTWPMLLMRVSRQTHLSCRHVSETSDWCVILIAEFMPSLLGPKAVLTRYGLQHTASTVVLCRSQATTVVRMRMYVATYY